MKKGEWRVWLNGADPDWLLTVGTEKGKKLPGLYIVYRGNKKEFVYGRTRVATFVSNDHMMAFAELLDTFTDRINEIIAHYAKLIEERTDG